MQVRYMVLQLRVRTAELTHPREHPQHLYRSRAKEGHRVPQSLLRGGPLPFAPDADPRDRLLQVTGLERILLLLLIRL